jgi:TonB family protein
MAGAARNVGAALALSVALHTLVLAAAPAMFRGASAPAEGRQAPIRVRLLAESPAAPEGSKARRSGPRTGSELAAGPQLGVVDGPRYLRGSELDSKPVPLSSVDPAPPAGTEKLIGRVIARILINESGTADAVRIESSEPEAVFDEAVKAAFAAARYRPGVKGGRSVKSQMLIEVTFHGAEPIEAQPSEPDSGRPR